MSDAALRASEIQYRRLFEAAKDGILMLNAETGEITAVNPFLADLLSYEASEILGKKLWEISPFEDETKSRVLFHELQSTEYVRYDDMPLETRAGRLIDVEFVSNIYLSDGRRVIQCNIRDITERRTAERARQASDERYHALFNYAPDGIVIAHPDGRYIDANTSMCTMVGYAREELAGLRTADVVVARDLKHIAPALKAISDAFPYHREWELRRKDGTIFCADVMATTMPDGNLLAMVRDLTTRKQAERAMIVLQAQLHQAQKMDAIGRLAGGVAHDFNNLLTVMLGCCEMLLEGDTQAREDRRDIEQIQHAGLRAAELTRQLLAFSRKQIIEPKVLDLPTIFAEMRPLLARLIREDVQVVIRSAPDVAAISADRGQLEQVIMNLAVNAQDAMPDGGLLTVDAANAGAEVAITVTDTGTGMTEEVRQRLFEPFFTTKPVGRGTGLGLATVHGIVAQSGGRVSVTTELGRGSAFQITFPRTSENERAVEPPNVPVGTLRGTETLLVVEDADGLRHLTKRLLTRLGYTVLVAGNAREALQLFEQHPSIALILTDVVMPGLSGPGLIRQLSAHYANLKVIYMSGYTDEAIVQHGVLQPGIAFVHKPFTVTALGRKIRDVLDSPSPGDVISYQIDGADRITAVGDGWDAFIDANDGSVHAVDTVGRSLWDFVSDDTTRQVYRDLIARVRAGTDVAFHYRCDSPTLRRFMRMTMRPGTEGVVTFDSQVIRTEPRRVPVAVMAEPDAGALLRVCGWCNRIAVAEDAWVEVEVAVERLGLLAEHPPIGVTHGMCPECFTRVMREVDAA